MTILDRYVAREFLKLFAAFTLGAPILFILGDWTDNIGRFNEAELPIGNVLLGYVYQFPLFMTWSFPIAALIATVFTVSNMARHSELAAAKAGGISFMRMLIALPVLGVLLTFAGLGLTELVPVTTAKKAIVMREKAESQPSRSSFLYRAGTGNVFAIRRLEPDRGRITGLVMEHEGSPPERAHLHLAGNNAVFDSTAGWTIHDGYLRRYNDDEGESMWRFESARVAGFTERPDQLLAIPKATEEMRYAELGEFIDIIRRSGGEPLELMVERAQKIAIPAATLIIILFGMPLANTAARSSAAYGLGISLGITIFYMMFFKIAGAAGATGALDPVLAAWLPNLVFAGAAVVLWGKVRT